MRSWTTRCWMRLMRWPESRNIWANKVTLLSLQCLAHSIQNNDWFVQHIFFHSRIINQYDHWCCYVICMKASLDNTQSAEFSWAKIPLNNISLVQNGIPQCELIPRGTAQLTRSLSLQFSHPLMQSAHIKKICWLQFGRERCSDALLAH